MGRDNLNSHTLALVASIRCPDFLSSKLHKISPIKNGTWRLTDIAQTTEGISTATLTCTIPEKEWDRAIQSFSEKIDSALSKQSHSQPDTIPHSQPFSIPEYDLMFSVRGSDDTDSLPEEPIIDVTRSIRVIHSGHKSTHRPDKNKSFPIEIIVDAGWAFGTGTHPSTVCALMALEHLESQNLLNSRCRVLDMGTGTGILAIAAAIMGAGEVVAVDIDPEALQSARKNTLANKVHHKVRVISAQEWERVSKSEHHDNTFDICLANLTPSVAARLMPSISACLKHNGYLILAGFKNGAVATASSMLAKQGLQQMEQFEHRGWGAIVATRIQILKVHQHG